ncbi:hypothetical protein ACQUY5_32480, partial [Bacillus cereus]
MSSKVCSVDRCNNEVLAKGMCRRHYKQKARLGRVKTWEEENKEKVCSIDGCGGKHEARGYCNKHYIQYKKYGKMRPDLEKG